MSVIWVLLVAATGAAPADSSQTSTATSSSVSAARSGTITPASTKSAERSAKEVRQAVADGLRRANAAKGADRIAAVRSLVDLFNELGRDRQLSAPERQRLGADVRSRLVRFATQFQHELTRTAQHGSVGATVAAIGEAGGGPAADGLDDLVNLIQKTIRPDDWVLAQRVGGAGAGGQGIGGGAAAGQAGAGGGFGGGIEQQTQTNGEALVDLIQNTIAPDSWDVRGGPGTIIYYNPLRALVIRQTGDVHDAIGDVLGAVRQ
jgi:hypothetical protein